MIDYEISNLNQRIERAKREGKYKGGKRKEISNFGEHYARYMAREVTKSALARELGISRPTLDKLIKEQFDLYETAMDNYDELADFSLEDLE